MVVPTAEMVVPGITVVTGVVGVCVKPLVPEIVTAPKGIGAGSAAITRFHFLKGTMV